MRDIEDYTLKYIDAGFEDYQVKYRRKKVLEILYNYKPRKVLEIGCGMEPLFKYADWEYETWTVVEPSVTFYENAKNIVSQMQKSKQVWLYNGFFPISSIKNSGFDFVICSGLLHEVENSSEFLEEIAAVCTKETIVHVNVPNANSLHRILARSMNLIKDVHDFSARNLQLQQHKVFDINLLKKEIENAGFFVLDQGSYFVKPFTHAQMYEMMKSNIIGEEVLDGLYAISDKLKEYGSEIYVNVKLG